MKKNFIYTLFLVGISVAFSSCLESDDFDGLTDSRPAIALEFPGREFDQQVGLGFIATGFANDPDMTYTLQLSGGGDVTISRIISVEGRAASIAQGTCPAFSLIEENVAVGGADTFDYTRAYSFFRDSDALCAAVLDVPDVWYELIFTVELSNGEEIVSQRVRGLFKE
ncbi:MAG: hypothetical protein AAFN93_05005 [Bacteroidota bacterium]